jgi:hypothetical protein
MKKIRKKKFYFCDEASVSDSLTFLIVVNSMPNDGVDCVDIIFENNPLKKWF